MPGLLGFEWVYLGAPKGRSIHSGSRGITQAHLGVVEFIYVRLDSLRLANVSSGSFWFAWVHSGAPSARWVHLGSLGFTSARLGVVGLIRVRVGSLRR